MPLVVAFVSNGKIIAAADSRISRGNSTATDAGAKLFVVPIVVRSRVDDQADSLSHTVGLAFAGSTLIANNVHSIVSSITQELYSDDVLMIPSLISIAKIYAAVGEYVTKDMNGRLQQKEQQDVHLLLFGGCKSKEELAIYLISPEVKNSKFRMKVEEWLPVEGQAYSIGNGRAEFQKRARDVIRTGNAPIALEVFREIIELGLVEGVGGYMQMIEAGIEGAAVCPILEQSEDNPDLVALTFLGFDTSAYGNIDGLSVGKRARSFGGAEKVGRRAALRARGRDPDDPTLTSQFENLIKFEYSISYARVIKSIVRLDGIIDIDNFSPQDNQRCLVSLCFRCKRQVALCRDKSWTPGSVVPLHQDGGVRTKCLDCHTLLVIPPSQIASMVWSKSW